MNNLWLKYGLPVCLLIAAADLIYRAGYAEAQREAELEQGRLKEQYHTAQLAAVQDFAAKLKEAADEKQKWFDFAQAQNVKLAEAYRRLDVQTTSIEKDIANAVEQDGSGFNGLGSRSLHIYKRAHGYAD